MNQEEIEQKAREVWSWLQDAYADAAVGELYMETGSQDYMKAEGIADRMTTEVDTICDLTGDRIYDEGKGSEFTMIAIAEAIKEHSHNEYEQKAMDSHIKRWQERIDVIVDRQLGHRRNV